jgi:hypothetical protein
VPRQNRRRPLTPLRAPNAVSARREQWRGQWWTVRTVPGANATKAYRCPGCAQLIPPGLPHLVAWPETDLDAGDRRHWHTACWAARDRRSPR